MNMLLRKAAVPMTTVLTYYGSLVVTAVEYLAPNIRIGTLWTVFDADVDMGFVLIGAGASLRVELPQ